MYHLKSSIPEDNDQVTKILCIAPDSAPNPNQDLNRYLESIKELDIIKLAHITKISIFVGLLNSYKMQLKSGLIINKKSDYAPIDDVDKIMYLYKEIGKPEIHMIENLYLESSMTYEFRKATQHYNHKIHFVLELTGTTMQWELLESLLAKIDPETKPVTFFLKNFPLFMYERI